MNKKNDKDIFEIAGAGLIAFGQYLFTHWVILGLAIVTGSFTWHAAQFYLPTFFYRIMAVVMTEGFFVYWLYLAEGAIETARADNKIETSEKFQIGAAIVGVMIAFTGIVLTDYAAAAIIAQQSEKFEIYKTLPVQAQQITANMVWLLAIIYVLLSSVYAIASPEAALIRAESRSARIIRSAEIDAKIKEANAESEAFRIRMITDAPRKGRERGIQRADARYVFNQTTTTAHELKGKDFTEGG